MTADIFTRIRHWEGRKKKKSVIKAAEEVIKNISEIRQGIPYQTPKFQSLDQFFKTSDAQTPHFHQSPYLPFPTFFLSERPWLLKARKAPESKETEHL